MSEASAVLDHADEVILPIIALASGYNGAVINITKDLNLYVRMGGSDANEGYADTDAHAFKTATRAYDEASRFIPSKGAKIIINVGPGVFAPLVAYGTVPGSDPIIVRGAGMYNTNFVRSSFTPHEAAIYANGAILQLEHLQVGGNGQGNGIVAIDGGIVYLGEDVGFSGVAEAHMLAGPGSVIYNRVPYHIYGNAARHMETWGPGALIEGGGSTVTIEAPITFSDAFAMAGNEGMIYNSNTDYAGREMVTGRRFYAYQWGYINTEDSGLNYFPGTVAGSWDTGGRYDTQGGANQGPPGAAGPMGPKSMSLQLPLTGDEVTMFYARAALTITQINAVVRGTTPGVTWQVLYAAARNTAGTPVLAATNTTSLANNTITTFTNPNVPANNWVWMKVTATSGVATELGLSLQF